MPHKPSTTQRQVVEVSLFYIHENYALYGAEDYAWPDGDIALIRFKQPVKFTNYVRPACVSASSDEPNDYRQCRLASWGLAQGKCFDQRMIVQKVLNLWRHSNIINGKVILLFAFRHRCTTNMPKVYPALPFI